MLSGGQFLRPMNEDPPDWKQIIAEVKTIKMFKRNIVNEQID